MGNTCELNLITSTGEIIKEEIISFITESSNGKIEILPNHIEINISTIPTKTTFMRVNGEKININTDKGLVYIKNNKIKFCCNYTQLI